VAAVGFHLISFCDDFIGLVPTGKNLGFRVEYRYFWQGSASLLDVYSTVGIFSVAFQLLVH